MAKTWILRCFCIISFIIIQFAEISLYSQSKASVLAYIEKHKATALNFEKQYGIPASITIAQAILESAAGTSSLTKATHNHFSIKAGNGWTGPVHKAWDDESVKSSFRCYNSDEESFKDYARLLTTSKNYSNLFQINVFDYRGWAHGLKKSGYATAPNYAQALIGLIDYYKLYEINGGAKLRPGKTIVITIYQDVNKPQFEDDDVISDDEVTEEEASVGIAISHYVVDINDIHCTVIQPGENLASVSRKYDISLKNLLKYNELSSEDQTKEGDIIFLDRKKKKYTGSQDVYISKGGESLHYVSQSFGIQLGQLAKMNNMSEYAVLEKGTRIYLK